MLPEYVTRTNNIKAFVEQTMANSNLNRRQKEYAIFGKLMEGPRKGERPTVSFSISIQ